MSEGRIKGTARWIGVPTICEDGIERIKMIPKNAVALEVDAKLGDEHRDELLDLLRECRKKQIVESYDRKDLSDSYIRHLLKGASKIKATAFPDFLVKLKRAHLQLVRAIQFKEKYNDNEVGLIL